MRKHLVDLLVVMTFCGLAIAQDQPSASQRPGPHARPPMANRMSVRGPGMGMAGRGMGRWWKNSELVQRLGIGDTQVQEIEKIFQEHRLQQIDLHAALEKQAAILEPLIEADQPDETQVIAQVDKEAQARANLEKSNVQMRLAIRRVLTVEQWKKLRAELGPRGYRFSRTGYIRRYHARG